MVGGSNPSAPATSSEMTNSKMNKLTHIQQQFLHTLHIQTLQARPELLQPESFDSITLPTAIDDLEMNSPEINNPEINCSEINSSEINSSEINSSEINSSEINSPEVDALELDSAERPNNGSVPSSESTAQLNELQFVDSVVGQNESVQILAITSPASTLLLQDLQQSLAEATRLQIWLNPNLLQEFTISGNRFFVRDLQILRQAPVKRHLWSWLCDHIGHSSV